MAALMSAARGTTQILGGRGVSGSPPTACGGGGIRQTRPAWTWVVIRPCEFDPRPPHFMNTWEAHLLTFGIPQTNPPRASRADVFGTVFQLSDGAFPSYPTGSFRHQQAKVDPREVAASGGLDQGNCASMDGPNVAGRSVAQDLSVILESAEVSRLIDELQATRWTGRPGYPLRAMIGMALAKSLYSLPTWTRTVALVAEHSALATVIAPDGDVPSVYACYRFTAKLRDHTHLLEGCIARVLKELKRRNPVLGWDVAIDASDMLAYANGQRFKGNKDGRERTPGEYSDPDASWGHRSAISTRGAGSFYGYKLHMAVCSKTDLPLAWTVETAKANESMFVTTLLDQLSEAGIRPETCAMDKGYDHRRVYNECDERGVLPIIALRNSRDVKSATTSRRSVSTATGTLPGPTTHARQRSGAVRLASASPHRRGGKPAACTR
jgi:Transposase DDE domain